MINDKVRGIFRSWFNGNGPGVYVMVDGQFGSTGKGLLAATMAEAAWDLVNVSATSAGPNSGHTAYFEDEKIILKQLPMFGVVAQKIKQNGGNYGSPNPVLYLCAGAVVDEATLREEKTKHRVQDVTYVHPYAARIDKASVDVDQANVRMIASTGKGVGPAMQYKLARMASSVVGPLIDTKPGYARGLRYINGVWFMEVSQGFSLGINSGFYPHVTSRECTVSQAMADLGLPPQLHRQTIMSVRTYPIRVGSTENSSGPCYPDQTELEWEHLGIQPEMTTVTNRKRRIFSWSRQQFAQSIEANHPDIIFVNFMNYLPKDHWEKFITESVVEPAGRIMGRAPLVLLGTGPRSENIHLWGSYNG